MSDLFAIAAVTETLSNLIQAAVDEADPGSKVVTMPPDEVAGHGTEARLNLFLYQTDVDGSLRNEDSLDLRPGETGDPGVPLVLHYLITPYVPGGHDPIAHRLLGAAIRVLHDHPVLGREELRGARTHSNVGEQLDRIRITWQPLEEKDIYSLWSAFQTPYRLSAAFEVRVVLIDSELPVRAGVPVLSRGRDDVGPVADASTDSPFPALTAAVAVDGQTAARVGEQVTLRGINLTAGTVNVVLTHPLVNGPVPVELLSAGSTEVRFALSSPNAVYPAGLWSAGLELSTGTGDARVVMTTNEVALAVAPTVTAGLPARLSRDAGNDVLVELTFVPAPLPGQQVALLFGSRSFVPRVVPGQPPRSPDNPQFQVTGVDPGTYPVRLRVAGVDSVLVDRSGDRPRFDGSQLVTVI
jgi:uncharacterized Zn-binding protein involved in type VI secretion